MTQITSNIGLKKGDIITAIEKSIISHGAGTPQHYFEDVEFTHKFVITRVNSKTYTCKYTEGAYEGSGFGWIKTDKIENEKTAYYID